MIDNLYDLSNTITDVVNRALEVATANTSNGVWSIDYDDVEDLIEKEDYERYLPIIADELTCRFELLEPVEIDKTDNTLTLNCGLAWCKDLNEDEVSADIEWGDRDLKQEPSMARLAEIGQKAIQQLIMQGSSKELSLFDLGVTPQETEYMREITGWQEVRQLRNSTALAPSPLAKADYESLLIESAQQKDKYFYENTFIALQNGQRAHFGTESSNPVFFYCSNDYGRLENNVLETHPKLWSLFRDILGQPPFTDATYRAAIVFGKPALVMSYNLEDLSIPGFYDAKPEIKNAAAVMLAGQLDNTFFGSHVKISCSTGAAAYERNKIIALIPADADTNLRCNFETSFARAIRQMPFTRDINWVKRQYDAICNALTEEFPQRPYLHPWTIDNLDKVALVCCQCLGEYLGKYQFEWDQATLTHNQPLLDQLEAKFDITKNKETLQRIINDGIWNADTKLASRVKLYIEPDTMKGKTDPFIVPIGQLYQALQKLGYEKDYPASKYLSNYSSASAKEVKALTDLMPFHSFSTQLRMAEAKRASENRNQTHAAKPLDNKRGMD